MTQIASWLRRFFVTFFLIVLCSGPLYGSAVTIQYEGAPPDDRKGVSDTDSTVPGNQIIMTPRKLKEKNDSGMETEKISGSVRREHYKPYREGEGERKIK